MVREKNDITNLDFGADQDELRTLFVSGLPSDVKQRELYLLFRAYTGTIHHSTDVNICV